MTAQVEYHNRKIGLSKVQNQLIIEKIKDRLNTLSDNKIENLYPSNLFDVFKLTLTFILYLSLWPIRIIRKNRNLFEYFFCPIRCFILGIKSHWRHSFLCWFDARL